MRKNQAKIRTVSDDEIRQLVKDYTSIRQILIYLNITSGTQYCLLKKRIKDLNLWDKFKDSQFWNRDKILYTYEEIFTKNSRFSNEYLKKVLLKDNIIEYKCSICGIQDWQNKKLTLELDHKDGDSTNNEIANLHLICPNCHSQTRSYCGKSTNTGKIKVKDEILLKALQNSNSIRDALLSLNLAGTGTNYKKCYKILYDNNLTRNDK